MSETASFVDPVFLARFGLSRSNVLDYFLHPLNPFRTRANTSNEVLAMQGIAIGTLMQHGLQHNNMSNHEPLSPMAAEEEYQQALSRLTGEQYELLPPSDPQFYTQPSPLYTIRHVLRQQPSSSNVSNSNNASSSSAAAAAASSASASSMSSSIPTILGIYYVMEGVIYKAPTVRSLMKTHVARVLDEALSGACDGLSGCARYYPSAGYIWVFEEEDEPEEAQAHLENAAIDPLPLIRLAQRQKHQQRQKRRKMISNHTLTSSSRSNSSTNNNSNNNNPKTSVREERTAAEEEGIRASEAMDQILVRLSRSDWVINKHKTNTKRQLQPIISTTNKDKSMMMSTTTSVASSSSSSSVDQSIRDHDDINTSIPQPKELHMN